MLGPKVSATVGVLVLVAVLAGCGGSSGVSPAAYVKSVCSAIGAFDGKLASQGSLNLTSSTAAQGRKVLQGFLSSTAAESDHALSQLKAAGSPSVTNGKAISASIVSAFTQVKGSLTQAASQAGSLPTTNTNQFKTAAAQLGSAVASSLASITTSLNSGLKSGALGKTFSSTPACQNPGV